MKYYQGEKSVGLLPIIVGVSVATALSFALMFFASAQEEKKAADGQAMKAMTAFVGKAWLV